MFHPQFQQFHTQMHQFPMFMQDVQFIPSGIPTSAPPSRQREPTTVELMEEDPVKHITKKMKDITINEVPVEPLLQKENPFKRDL